MQTCKFVKPLWARPRAPPRPCLSCCAPVFGREGEVAGFVRLFQSIRIGGRFIINTKSTRMVCGLIIYGNSVG